MIRGMIEPFYQDRYRTIYLGDMREVVPQLGIQVTAVVSVLDNP